jgi:hypothetical protein
MIEKHRETGFTRRAFGRNALATGIVAAAGAFMLESKVEGQAPSDNDVIVLNFALNLEYLEAEFYTVATTGKRLSDVGIATTGYGREGATVGGGIVALDARTSAIAAQIALDEQAHVRVLRAALGNSVSAKPAINLEALGLGFRNQNEFLTLARAFEDLGVSAYAGAAALISNDQILTTAARIALTEGQHAGALRILARDANLTVPQVDPLDVPPQSKVFQVDAQGLSTIRTPNQVLAVVYANATAGTGAGGFFPSGVNSALSRV